MKQQLHHLALAAILATGAAFAHAADIKVSLNGAEETVPVTTSATGTGVISIGADKRVTGSIATKDIEGTAAHIHNAPAGKNGPPVITLVKSADGVWSVPAGAALTDEQYASYQAGNLYVNVHSAANKPGEIRGQLRP
ncbi:MAG: CHRD domain-containing protein [Massilia sp.]